MPNLPLADPDRISIWGHSNGGQIAITVAEILKYNYPTVLWAPVTKPFPYSILYYTDDSEDRGKLIRHELAEFEKNYDPDKYSLDLFLKQINAPLMLHQGTNDDAVPVKWSDNFIDKLNGLDKDITYYKYPGADHNLRPLDNWNLAIKRSLDFYQKNINN